MDRKRPFIEGCSISRIRQLRYIDCSSKYGLVLLVHEKIFMLCFWAWNYEIKTTGHRPCPWNLLTQHKVETRKLDLWIVE